MVGFEPTIPVFKRAKTGHASDRATTVIGKPLEVGYILWSYLNLAGGLSKEVRFDDWTTVSSSKNHVN
jgi:hypothetical protein